MYLERWTIDEITESTATLLRSQYSGEVNAGAATDLAPVVISAELDVTSERWSAEVDSVLERAKLRDFISESIRRSRFGELREARSLREGDVYWAVFHQRPPPLERIGPGGTGAFLDLCLRLEVQIGDVTAAARQAAKVIYSRALESRQRRG